MTIFTGMETKLMLNNKAAELKRSHVKNLSSKIIFHGGIELDIDVDRFIKFVFELDPWNLYTMLPTNVL